MSVPSAAQRGPTIAILGGGMIAQVHHRAALLAGARIGAVLDATAEASERLARRWGAPRALSHIDELADCDAEVVHICTPNATHAAYASAALRAGKHVICEKPLGIDRAEADRLAALAAETGLIAVVPYVYRFHPLVREIRARRIAGDFGSWHVVHGSYLQDWLLSPLATSWRVDPKKGGPSRAFADIGTHWCDLMEWVSGERIVELNATMTIAVPKRPVAAVDTFAHATDDEWAEVTTEDAVTVTFRTAGGVLGNVVISQVSAGRKNRLWLELDGEYGSVVFDQENPETVWLGGEDSATILHRDPARGADDARRLSSLPAGHPQGFAQCFENLVADTYAAVRGEHREGLPTFADGARSMAIVDAVVQSANSTTWSEVHP